MCQNGSKINQLQSQKLFILHKIKLQEKVSKNLVNKFALVNIKWKKTMYNDIEIDLSKKVSDLKDTIYGLTEVPQSR